MGTNRGFPWRSCGIAVAMECDYGQCSPWHMRLILQALLKDGAFSAVLLLLFVTELLSCCLGGKGGQKGPWKHSARIWNLSWAVANAYFLLENWERRLGPREYQRRRGIALIWFISLLFQNHILKHVSLWGFRAWVECIKFSALS